MDMYTLALSIAYSNKIGKQIKDQAFKTQIESNRDILNTTGEEKIFYFLPKENDKPQNGYDEYIYINNNWELMGGTDIDLSSYVTLSDLSTALKDKEDTANKISAITAENKSSSTLFPTVGATTQFIENNYYTQAEINSMIGDIGTRLDQVRGVSNE